MLGEEPEQPVPDLEFRLPNVTQELAEKLCLADARTGCRKASSCSGPAPADLLRSAGTGKTYVAQELASTSWRERRRQLVQFHPAYSYEDFFEGYRPAKTDDRGLRLAPGR